MALLPWRTGRIIGIKNEAAETKSFRIEVGDTVTFDFKPGQFVTFDLPIDSKPNKRLRSYSIASSPDGTNVFELVIVRDKKGTGTRYLFEEVHTGSELRFRGPQGIFTLKEPLEKDLFLICTGTGIAPFRSMIGHINNKCIPHHDIHLIFGCRTREDLLYYEEMTAFEASLTGFHYHPTLSREKWEGHTGYVHDIYESLCREHQPATFYLCGWKGMIDDAETRILAMGYDKKAIHTEIYG